MNKKRISHLVIALMPFCSGCFHAADLQEHEMSPAYVNEFASTLDGRKILVRGYLTLEPGAHNLYESEELSDEFDRRWDQEDSSFDPKAYNHYCLTIANPQVLMARSESLNNTTVVVRGTVLAKYLDGRVDLGACPMPAAILLDSTFEIQKLGRIKKVSGTIRPRKDN